MHSKGQSTLYNILIVVIVIGVLSVLGGVGYLGYQKWFGSEEEKPVSEEKPTPEKKGEEEEEEPSIVDCGVSESFSSNKPLNQIDFEKDSALVCLGESLLNDCRNAKAIVKDKSSGKITAKIKGTKGNCMLGYQYGSADQIPSEDQKHFANKYIECPIEGLKKLGTQPLEKDPSQMPGSYIMGLYLLEGMVASNPQAASKAGCSGTILD